MIKPEELRKGNMVLSCEMDLPCQVQTIGVSDLDLQVHSERVKCEYVVFKYYNIDPISLTPEWLQRCGFERDGQDRWIGPEYETDNTVQWFEIEDDKKAGFYWLRGSEWVMGRPFQFLHQLQNLYFALTGEELQIKMP